MGSKFKGAGAVRRMIRRLPDAVQREIVGAFERWGREIAVRMRGRAPRRTGALIEKIRHKVFPRTLRLQVGLLGSKKERSRLFYARIQDLGRKGRTVRARRAGSVSSYALRVGALRPLRFITGPISDLRSGLRRHIHGIYDRALRRSAVGGDE